VSSGRCSSYELGIACLGRWWGRFLEVRCWDFRDFSFPRVGWYQILEIWKVWSFQCWRWHAIICWCLRFHVCNSIVHCDQYERASQSCLTVIHTVEVDQRQASRIVVVNSPWFVIDIRYIPIHVDDSGAVASEIMYRSWQVETVRWHV